MEIAEFSTCFSRFVDGFETKVINEIQRNKNAMVGYITEQLYSGVDGNGNYLHPTYLQDPYFNTEQAGRWYKKPQWYMAWKNHITPPARAYIGIPPRPKDVPNLIISGTFYDSIMATDIQGGIKIDTEGVSFGRDIVQKYGESIFKLGEQARYEFYMVHLCPAIEDYWKECGL